MKILSTLTSPSGVAYVLFVLGLVAVLWSRTRKTSWWLLAASGAVHVTFSTGVIAAALMRPLDYAYPAVHKPQQFAEVRHIVVLTGWAADDPDMPLTGRFGVSTAYRVLMTLELYIDRPDCDVLISGGPETARIMAEALMKLGVPKDRVRLEDRSATTAESAANLQPLLGRKPFFLVTSAGHLPRSMGALEKLGLNAIPVPTDHQLPKNWRRAEWHPTPASLVISDRAMHEYVGLLWYRLRGRL
jgi:uncharacterized SAM-binding protein YcdF (DUF218 family)